MEAVDGVIVLTFHFNNAFTAGQSYVLPKDALFGFTDGNMYLLDGDYTFTFDGTNWSTDCSVLKMSLNAGAAKYMQLKTNIPTGLTYGDFLLGDTAKLQGVLREELIEIRDKFGDKRKTEIQEIEDEIDIEDLIEEETCAFTISNQGYVKRMPVDTYRTQSRGGRGVNAQNLKEEDFVKSLNVASTHDHMLFFTDMGRVHHRKGYQIPEAGRTARGTAMVNVLPLEPGEAVTAMVVTREFHEDEFLMMVTKGGTVKRIPFIALKTNRKTGIRAITLEEDDHLINVIRTNGNDNIILATRNGMAICFNENDARPMGRDAAGVRGILLSGDDCVIGAEKAEEGKTLLQDFLDVYTGVVLGDEYTDFVSRIIVEGHTDPVGDYNYNQYRNKNPCRVVNKCWNVHVIIIIQYS